jgi:hypothetical protein
LLFSVSQDVVVNQKLCLQGNDAWKMVEVDDDNDSDWGVDNKRIVDSEGFLANRGELEQSEICSRGSGGQERRQLESKQVYLGI